MNKHIKYRDIDLSYSDKGEGPCIVLLHGYLERGAIWQSFIDSFPGACRFIVPDLPGHGASGTWGKVHSMDELAGAVLAILEEEGIPGVFLAGHSMGGYVTMAFADLFPERITGYALVHSTPFADTEEKRENRKREISLVLCGKKRQIVLVNIPKAFAMDNLETMASQVELAKGIALASPDDGTIALLKGMKERPDRTRVLQDPGLPLLMIGGMKDNYIPVEVFDKLISLAPHARVLRLEESGHMGFMEEPHLVHQAFMAMLSPQ
ncbi:MAG: alpha/beta hydrolase [Bacteroidota bacterium]|nr:alpha/beta hydrolase [Bacteroidota bacterium]